MKNLQESVRQKLKNVALEANRPFDEILRYYAIERFLYRLGISPHVGKFFLKGGLMLRVWDANDHRATMDIDLLARTSNQLGHIQAIIREVAQIRVEEDAILYDTECLRISKSQARGEYEGFSARFSAKLTKTRIPVQIDIGFSDMIIPKAQKIFFPTLISVPPPRLMGYTAETVVAEKLESIVKLGRFNTRMKDFFDVWTILGRDQIPLKAVDHAIHEVFKNRGTPLQFPYAFTSGFSSDPVNQKRWQSFLKGLGKEGPSLNEVTEYLAKTLRSSLKS